VALAPSLLHKSSMTKKRVKFGLAILGGLTVFLLALLALVFVPTGASAGKGPVFGQEQDGGAPADHPNPAYFEPPAAGLNNGPGHAEGGVGSCAGTLCDTYDNDAPGDEAWHYADNESGGQGGNSQGNGHSNGDTGEHSPAGNPWLFPGSGGGFPGSGAPRDQSNSCGSQKDKDGQSKDKESDEEKACNADNKDASANGEGGDNKGGQGDGSGNTGDGLQQLTLLDDQDSDSNDDKSDGTPGAIDVNLVSGGDFSSGETDDDLPPVDPNCFPFTEGCEPHKDTPPDTVLTDPPNKVPEPLTLSLFAAGLTGAAALRRRQNKSARPD